MGNLKVIHTHTGKISWPWVWVLSPLWISFILGCILFFVVLVAAVIDAFKD